MTLYSYYRSSASYRVRIILNYKNISYKTIPVHLLNNGGEQNLENYQKINELQQVPSLLHNGEVITQSMAIAQYLEAIYPEPALIPTKALNKAYVLQICEIINASIQPLHNLSVLQKLKKDFLSSDADTANWCKFWITKGLKALEKQLSKQAGRFALGDNLSLADVFIIPQLYSAKRYDINFKDFPLLKQINNNANLLEAFIKAHPAKQIDSPDN